MAFVSRLGHSTSYTAATASFSMHSSSASKCSWPRFPSTSFRFANRARLGAKTENSAGRAGKHGAWTSEGISASGRRLPFQRRSATWSSTRPGFASSRGKRRLIKDTDKGPQVWEVKWAVFWRKDEDGLPTRRHCLIVARNVLTGEVKYFLANRVPGEPNPVTGACVTLRWLLRVAFGRCSIESCFREGKEELGMDHYEVRGWRCLHRHFYVTQLTHLFCARMRLACDTASENELDRVTVEQVRSVVNIWLDTADLPPAARRTRIEDELRKQQWYQRRNKQARKSHTKTRIGQLAALGIDVDKIKSCLPRPPT